MTTSLGMLGAGNMGLAILRGGLRAGLLAADSVFAFDPDDDRQRELGDLGVTVVDQPGELWRAEQLLLAVKPQVFPVAAEQLGPPPEPRIVISIMAGLSSGTIRDALGERAHVIRVMPNTPCQIGAGATGVALGVGASAGDEDFARALFEALGVVVAVDEDLMHAVTAVSGSGPAYIFLLAEAMIAGGEAAGLAADQARVLATQTVLGAARLLAESGETASALRRAVTSPGGTTAAGIETMTAGGLPNAVKAGVLAARDRGVELDQA